MSLHYAQNVRNTGPSNVAETFGFENADWHQAASADTGTSHTLPGRLYIVQCEWCTEAFAAKTKGEAMDMFREHEDAMLVASDRAADNSIHNPDDEIFAKNWLASTTGSDQ